MEGFVQVADKGFGRFQHSIQPAAQVAGLSSRINFRHRTAAHLHSVEDIEIHAAQFNLVPVSKSLVQGLSELTGVPITLRGHHALGRNQEPPSPLSILTCGGQPPLDIALLRGATVPLYPLWSAETTG